MGRWIVLAGSLVVSAALVALAAYVMRPPEPPRPALTQAPTHERYAAALSEFGLDKTALGREWVRVAEAALAEPVEATLPFSESGYLTPSAPAAVGYRFDLRQGRKLLIDVTFETTGAARLYIDLFEVAEESQPRLVASTTPDARHLEYEARRDATYVLRVQPELLRGGRYTIVERSLASLGFPVDGLSTAAVQSVFGDPRDGGRRDHHGLDIFAPRGTPVLAAVDGSVRTDTGNRGGNVIWLSPTNAPATGRRRRRLYYAHLNGWAVEDGARVRQGDVIGYVGNTGNARTTPPHLHFGVYDRGPVDPYPYLRPDDGAPPRVVASLDLIQAWARVVRPEAVLRAGAFRRATVLARLGRDVVVRVEAAAAGYYRVALPDGTVGYMSSGDITAADHPLASEPLGVTASLFDRPAATAPVMATIGPGLPLDILGRFGAFQLVRLPDARLGWVRAD
jgi:murein DD-endopeptidase MepM/ murein hydrolase activator NlpD